MTGLSHGDVARLLAAIDGGDSSAVGWRVEVEALPAPKVLVRSPSVGRLCWEDDGGEASQILGAVLVGGRRIAIKAPVAGRCWTRLAPAGAFVEFGQAVALSAATTPAPFPGGLAPRPRAPRR